jgi:hypothetical protein
MRTNTPRFEHDCLRPGCCRYAGRTLNCDVYAYGSMLDETGMIMRRSDDGPDYSSWPALRYAEMAAAEDAEVFHAVQLVNTLLESS